MKYFSLFILVLSGFFLYAQENCNISGIVTDAVTSKPLPGATIYDTINNTGTATRADGTFLLKTKCRKTTLKIAFLGYDDQTLSIFPQQKRNLNIQLNPTNYKVKGIDISAKKPDDNIKSNRVGTTELSQIELKNLPGLSGTPDIIGGLRLTPGVQSVGEGNSGIFVRGGDAGQNLILFNDIPLYNPSHLMGFFPAFDANVADKISVSKGAIPANYGGKVSSVIDISSKTNPSDTLSINGSLGLLSAGLTLHTPIFEQRGSLLISGRRTYLEALKPLVSTALKSTRDFFNKTQYHFYDVTLAGNVRLSAKDRLFVTAIMGKDSYVLGVSDFNFSNKMYWGNRAASLRYNRIYNSRLSSNLLVGITQYGFSLDAGFNQYQLDLSSEIRDYFSKLEFSFRASEKLKLKFGANFTRHLVKPNNVQALVQNVNYNNAMQFFSNESSTYLQSSYTINKNIILNTGLRITVFQHMGPYASYVKDPIGQTTDSVIYNQHEIVKNYFSLSPNLSFVYLLNKQASIKGSVGLSHQFIHLISVASVSLPTDIWLPANDFIRPQKVSVFTLGYFHNFFHNTFESSIELYYKALKNQVEFANGILDNFDNEKIKENIVFGTGQAYGAEFYLKKQLGKTTGWISYTLSRTWRNFPDLNKEKFPAKYDRVHDFSITLNHKFNNKWNLSAVFIYATGNAQTLPVGRYFIQGSIGNEYSAVNAFRMPPYHRVDVSVSYHLKNTKQLQSDLTFSIYNIYNRANPYFIYFQAEGNLDEYYLKVAPQQISLFPILPTLTWNFTF